MRIWTRYHPEYIMNYVAPFKRKKNGIGLSLFHSVLRVGLHAHIQSYHQRNTSQA